MAFREDSLDKLKDLDAFIIRWNNSFPYDYWWRKKYGIPFNSDDHRSMSPIDMYIDHREEKLLKKNYDESTDRKKRADKYMSTGEFLRIRERYVSDDDMSQEEIEKGFEEMEI